MMVQQVEIILTPRPRGFHLVTGEIVRQLPRLPKTGLLHLFCQHTSCGLSINENADPDVRVDMETIFDRLVPENCPDYERGVSLTIPVTDGRLNLGTWQGIYLCEYRNYGGARRLVATVIGE